MKLLPSIQFIACPVEPASFVLTPAVVVTQGIFCECCEEVDAAPSFLIQLQWLMWGCGIILDFSAS